MNSEKITRSMRKLQLVVGLLFLNSIVFAHPVTFDPGAPFANSESFCPEPDAAFNNNVTGLWASFQDMSTNTPTSWHWQFGDGNTGSGSNPTHQYAYGGTYNVCLTATNACGSDTWCTQVTVICPEPDAMFMEAASQLNVSFIDFSTNNPTWWSWDFGDGATATGQYPIHAYTWPGAYQVCLVVGNACGQDTFCTNIQVACSAPAADFNRSATGATVSFNDISSNTPTQWSWSFGDGNSSTQKNPSHTYAASGTYQVTLSVQNNCGSSTMTYPVQITCSFVQADFGHVANSLTARFSDQTQNSATSWSWDFGDGQSSSVENPIHSYSQPGVYTVSLTSSNSCNSSTIQKTVTVTCTTMAANFVEHKQGFAATFTDLCIGSPTWWDWEFGDGAISTQQHPTHTYNKKGKFKVCLTAGNACGTVTTCRIIEIDPTRRKTTASDMDKAGAAISLYPNPSQGTLRISGDANELKEIRIMDLQGVTVQTVTGDWDADINLSSLANGMYLAQILTQNGSRIQKIQIRH